MISAPGDAKPATESDVLSLWKDFRMSQPVNTQMGWILGQQDISDLQNAAFAGSTTAPLALAKHFIMNKDAPIAEGSRMPAHQFWLAFRALQGDGESLTALRQHEALSAQRAHDGCAPVDGSSTDSVLWGTLGCSMLLNVTLVVLLLLRRWRGGIQNPTME